MPIKIWGVTGFAGTGKSAALRYLSDEGYPICDADDLSGEVLDSETEDGRANLQELLKLLGPQALTTNGEPNRAFLRQVIADVDPQRRKIFEGWIFPKIIAKFEAIKAQWEKDENTLGFVEGSRLVESGYVASLEGLIVVQARREIRKKRLIDKRGMKPEEAEVLLNLLDEKMVERQADFRWDNSTTLAELHKQVEVFLMVADPNS